MTCMETLASLAARATGSLPPADHDGVATAAPVPGLLVLQSSRVTPLRASLYEPVVCLIVQGEKEAIAGDTRVRFGAGESLIVSHDVPVVSRITKARREAPYLALIFSIELAVLRSLYEEVGDTVDGVTTCALEVHEAEPHLLDSLGRYLALAADPLDAKVLGPLLRREIHFRLLRAPHGATLRRLLRHDSHESKIARAIARIRLDFKSPLVVPALAREIGMSASSFHKHFKAITSTTPLQYQKDLRLLEARRLLSSEGLAVSTVAFEIGYESASQFSREYSRKFGVPPRADLADEP